MKNLNKKRYKSVRNIVIVCIFSLCFTITAFASSVDFKETTLFKGTANLLWAGVAALTALAVALTTFFGVKAGIAWQAADDQDKPQKKKALINTVAIGVLVACLTGLITLILGVYGLSDGTGGGTGTVQIESTYQLIQNIYQYKLT